jgi:hypothetical protein
MQPLCHTRKNRASLGACLIANGDDVRKQIAALDEIENFFRPVAGNVDAGFAHRLDDNGIEFASFESGALRFKLIAANLIQERLGHLAAGAVVDANKQDTFFHNSIYLVGWGLGAQQSADSDGSHKLNFKGLESDAGVEAGIHLSIARQAVCRTSKCRMISF